MIVPAILSDKKEELVKMLNVCSAFTDYVQIDIMDGEFVPSKSITPKDLKGLQPALRSEAHLMVNNPLEWLEIFKNFGSQRIIFHFEIKEDHSKIIERIKRENLEVGIAINPSTNIDDFKPILKSIDVVLFLSVNPGFYGSPFIPEVLDKIKSFKKLYPDKTVGIDGGIKLSNIKTVKDAGADYICIGSAILKANNPKEEYLNLLKIVNE
jgi:ribulose-phosphate 3-epimerase